MGDGEGPQREVPERWNELLGSRNDRGFQIPDADWNSQAVEPSQRRSLARSSKRLRLEQQRR